MGKYVTRVITREGKTWSIRWDTLVVWARNTARIKANYFIWYLVYPKSQCIPMFRQNLEEDEGDA
eukprot:4042041-Ditylum_brightwellii.AAC.1